MVLPWRHALLGDVDLDGVHLKSRVPSLPLDGPHAYHPAVERFQEFLDARFQSQNPEEALEEYLTRWRPEDRVHHETLQNYIGDEPTDSYPYSSSGHGYTPAVGREPYAVLTYPPGYELDADDPRPGNYYSRRRRRRR